MATREEMMAYLDTKESAKKSKHAQMSAYLDSREGASPEKRGRMDILEARAASVPARRKTRADMLKVLGDELAYDVWSREDLTPRQKLQQAVLKGPTTAMKGIGVFGQRLESGAASGLEEIQQAAQESRKTGIRREVSPMDLARAVKKGITDEPTHEIGDVARASMTPVLSSEPAAATLGLLGSAALPGPGQAVKAMRPIRQAVMRSVGSGAKKLGHAAVRTHLVDILGISEGSAKRAIEKGFGGITSSMDLESAERGLRAARLRGVRTGRSVKRAAGDAFEAVLEKEKDKIVPVTTIIPGTVDVPGPVISPNLRTYKQVEEINTLTQDAWDKVEQSLRGYGNRLADVPGAQELVDKLNEIDVAVMRGTKPINVQAMRTWIKEIGSLASDRKLGSVQAVAADVGDSLRDVLATASPEIADANVAYSKAIRVLKGANTEAAAEDVLGTYKKGAAPIESKGGFYRQNLESRQALEKLQRLADEQAGQGKVGHKFIEQLKDASYMSEFASGKSVKGLSMAAMATIAFARPQLIPAVVLAGGALTPKVSAQAYKNMFSFAERVRRASEKPVSSALQDLFDRGFIGSAMMRGTRQLPYEIPEDAYAVE